MAKRIIAAAKKGEPMRLGNAALAALGYDRKVS
jgi:hypothetical protein